MLGPKTRSLGQILEKPFVLCRGLIFGPIIMKPDQNVCLDEIRMNSKMGLVRSKARSLGQILEKPFVCSRGHIFSLIIMKITQHVCMDVISHKFENGSCQVKR